MPINHYVTLGRSGLKVSPFCLGAMTFGEEWGFGTDPTTSCRLIDHFISQGGNFIDTANIYNGGHSERIIGEHIGRDAAKRDGLVIATKFGGSMSKGNPNNGGGNRKSIMMHCEASLRRLQTDYIDLYWMHWEDPFTPVEETMAALNALVEAGKVRYIGISDTHAWKVARAQTVAEFRGWAPLVALQIEYSLLERSVENELIPMAQALGLGITPWSPLRSGVLSGKYARDNMKAESLGRADWVARNANERTYKVLDMLTEVAARHQTTVACVAIAWVLCQPGVTAPILGARTQAQLENNLAAIDVNLLPEDIAALNRVSAPKLDFMTNFLNGAVNASYPGITVNGTEFSVNARSKTTDGS